MAFPHGVILEKKIAKNQKRKIWRDSSKNNQRNRDLCLALPRSKKNEIVSTPRLNHSYLICKFMLIFLGRKYPKSKAFSLKTNRRVERLCEMIFESVLKIPVHIVVVPKFIVSFVTYFTTHSGPDSFQLPAPLW